MQKHVKTFLMSSSDEPKDKPQTKQYLDSTSLQFMGIIVMRYLVTDQCLIIGSLPSLNYEKARCICLFTTVDMLITL